MNNKWDTKTLQEFVKRLEEHYPHSPSICNTIDKVANEMLVEEVYEYRNDKTSHEYLLMVLQRWGAFCKGHRNFENAIKELLAENEQLKIDLRNLKG